jgi:hypothetical protein
MTDFFIASFYGDSSMTNDDIIRKFLDLHPDTPIDDKQYAVPLWVIRRMLETAEAAEREACAKEIEVEICDEIEDEAYCILVALLARIRARGQE